MRTAFLAILLLNYSGTWGQSQYNADSVEQIFESLPDSIRIREANNLMKYYMDADFKKSMYYAQKAIELSDKVDNQDDVAYTYVSWAIAQYNFSNYHACLNYNFKALAIYQNARDTTKMAVVYNNLSSAFNALGDYSAAVHYAYQAFLIHSANNNPRKAAISCDNISVSYFASGDYEATMLWANRACALYKSSGSDSSLGYALQIIVDVHLALKQLDSARFYLRQVQLLNKKFPNEYLETINTTQLGEIFYLEENYDSAIIMHNKCIRFYEDLDMSDGALQTRLSIARAFMALGKWDEGLAYARDAHERSQKIDNHLMMAKSAAVVAEALKGKHRFEEALPYMQLSAQYKDSILLKSIRGSIEGRFMEVKLQQETQEKLTAMSTLEQRNAVIGTQWAVIGVAIIGLLGMMLMVYLIRRAAQYRKKLNAQLTASNRRLSELNREINGLVNTIVHDLKSPLNSAQGILSLIERTAGKNDELHTLLAMANKSLSNGQDIVQQLLELRELEDNQSTLNLSEINLHELAQEIHDSFHLAAGRKEIRLDTSFDSHRFVSDKVLVRRVLDNLVSNALKFSQKGSEVKVTGHREKDTIVFTVHDHGPGFSADDLQKIYGRFQKLSARPTDGENSNGLGLATVNLLMRHLRGTVSLQTSQGVGSVFKVTLPQTLGNIDTASKENAIPSAVNQSF